MRKLAALLVTMAILLMASVPVMAGVYPSLIVVDHIEPGPVTPLVVGDDATGNTWDFPDYGGDWEPGDFAACIFYDNETPSIYDDTIIMPRYAGHIELVYDR